jgi:biopolymer transport protein ExbB
VITYLLAGGPVMVPILLCSVVALAMFLERLWALRRARVLPPAFLREVGDLVSHRRHDDAIALCRRTEAAAARLFEVALQARARPREQMKERLEELGRREAAEMERGVPVVGTIAAIAPLLGLLGTVGGMILTFQAIQEQGMGNVGSLAGGISQALITTFAGLTVGIPAVMANRYLLSRVDGLLIDLEEVSLELLDVLDGQQRGPEQGA